MNGVWQAAFNGALASAILAAAVWLVLRLAPRSTCNAAARHAIWWIVLAVVVALPWGGAIGGRTAPADLRFVALHSASTGELPPPAMASRASIPAPSGWPLRIPARPWMGQLTAILSVIWAAGSLVMLLRLGLSYRAMYRARTEAVPGWLQPRARGWLARCGSHRAGVGIACSREISIPVAAGPWRPRIIIPSALVEGMSGPDLEQAGLHEAAHLARRDDWWLAVQRILEALFWVHPVARRVMRQIDLEREIACDDLVVAATHHPRAYAACLTRLVELCRAAQRLPAAAQFAGHTSHLIRRVELLMKEPRNTRTQTFTAGLAMSAAVLAAAGWLLVKAPVMVALAAPEAYQRPRDVPPPPQPPPAPEPLPALEPPLPPEPSPDPAPPQAPSGRDTVLFFETAGMPNEEVARAIAAAKRFFDERRYGDGRVAVMVADGGARPVVRQDFTSDSNTIKQALDGLAGMGGGNRPETSVRLAAFQNAFDMLAPLSGKKALLYFTAERIAGTPDVKSQLDDTIKAAQRANVAIYVIDVH